MKDNVNERVAVVAGANVGLGSALCAKLVARGLRVVALGRAAATRDVATEVPGVRAVACELTNPDEVAAALRGVEEREGAVSVAIYNAHRLALAAFADTTVELFEQVWRTTCFGAMLVARAVLPGMKARGDGALLFIGATASVRGGPRSAAFASAKFALRGLAQSLAREHGPMGVHIAHAVLDGLIACPQTEARFPTRPEGVRMLPHVVAEELVRITLQPRSAWTHELDLRPFDEKH